MNKEGDYIMNNMTINKYMKITITILAIVLCSSTVSSRYATAKDIYFAGEYKDEDNVLEMNEYSSPDSEKEVGNFSIIAYGGKARPQGTLIKIGKNKYKCKKYDIAEGEAILIFKVKKKKVIVKQKGKIKTARYGNISYAGTYKLNKRFYS